MDRASSVGSRVFNSRKTDRIREMHEFKKTPSKSDTATSNTHKYANIYTPPKYNRIIEGTLYTDRHIDTPKDNRLLYEQIDTISRSKSVERSQLIATKRSLNIVKQKKQGSRISQDNSAMLKRLKERSASYNVNQYENDRKRIEERFGHMCEYPYILGVTGSSSFSRNGINTDRSVHSIIYKKYQPRKLEPLGVYSLNRTVLFKRGLEISKKYFMVEISTDSKWFYIVAYDVENPERYCLNILVEDCFRIMNYADNLDMLVRLLEWNGVDLILNDDRNLKSLQESN